jgi:hypothetical protein
MTPNTLLRDCRGASAAEFALVLPLLLLMLFGIIDAGRFAWEFNKAEKATQVGARVAVVTDVIPGGLATASYVGVSGLTQGDVIPASALGLISCWSASGTLTCSCTPPNGASPCPALGTANTASFDRIVTRMQYMKPDITASNVRVEYRGSGLGFAGDPNGMEVAPLVTVRLSGLQFKPITALLFATIAMPDFRTSLTAEDSSGSQSN